MRRVWILAAIVFCFGALGWAFSLTALGHRVVVKLIGGATVEKRLEQYGEASRANWRGDFEHAGVAYPPDRVTLVGIKDESVLKVYADDKLVRTLPVLAQSGTLGPKRRRGDRQVPEGVYGVESLHLNSRFHLALRVDYPNDVDRKHANGADLGGDIMIHGGAASVGCLAMGDEAAEDLFTLAADVGVDAVTLLVAPVDLTSDPAVEVNTPHEVAKLARIRACLADLR